MSYPAATPLPRFLTVPEVAELLQVSVRTVWRAIDRGEIPVVRLGRLVRVNAAALGTVGQTGKPKPPGPPAKTLSPEASKFIRANFPNHPAWKGIKLSPEEEP